MIGFLSSVTGTLDKKGLNDVSPGKLDKYYYYPNFDVVIVKLEWNTTAVYSNVSRMETNSQHSYMLKST